MKLRSYIDSLGAQGVIEYAARCQIAVNYLRLHVKYANKNPSVSLIKALARESEGHVRLMEVLVHFGLVDTSRESEAAEQEKRRPKGRPVPPGTHHHSAVGSR